MSLLCLLDACKVQQISEFRSCKSVIVNFRFSAVSFSCVVRFCQPWHIGNNSSQSPSPRQSLGPGAGASAKTGGPRGRRWGCGGPTPGPAAGAGASAGRLPGVLHAGLLPVRLQGGVCSSPFLEAAKLTGHTEGSMLAAVTASSEAAWLLGYRPSSGFHPKWWCFA